MVRSMDSGIRLGGFDFSLSFTSFMQLWATTVPQFPHLKNGDGSGYLIRLLQELNEFGKPSELCLTHMPYVKCC